MRQPSRRRKAVLLRAAMTRLLAVTTNTFLQTVRQPIYAIIVLATLGSFIIAPAVTGWTLDDDDKMLRDLCLSSLLVQGLFLAAFSAAGVISVEIEQKTVLTVAAKPVPRGVFIAGKYLGVLAAIALAHYLATIGMLMCLRHGVLQTSADEPDITVIVLGPGVVLAMIVAAALANYLFDWKFLPTSIAFVVPALTVSMLIVTTVDRDWKLKSRETVMDLDRLPDEITSPDMLRGIIEFRPEEGKRWLPGAGGKMVRRNWLGPINDAERDYLRGLSENYRYRQQLDFLIAETRKLTTPELLKAAYLLLVALSVMCAIAIAASTRLSTVTTLIVCIVALCVGLVTDHYLQPLDEAGVGWGRVLYRVLPNFQFFWMIDALADDRVIPWSYVGRATGFAVCYALAVLALAAALFETREVG
jgi:hypothetical protein